MAISAHDSPVRGTSTDGVSWDGEGLFFSGDLELILMAVSAAVFFFIQARKRQSIRDAGREHAQHAQQRAEPAPRPVVRALPLDRLVKFTIEMRIPTQKALESYLEMRQHARHLSLPTDLNGKKYSAQDYYSALVQCAGRGGFPQHIGPLLDDMVEVGLERPLSIFESAMRLLAGKKQFKEAIAVFERLESDGLDASDSTLSCVVSFAAELGDYEFAIDIYNKLAARTTPNVRATVTILRVHARRSDWQATKAVLSSSRNGQTCFVDAPMLQIALGTGVQANSVDEAEVILLQEPFANVADTLCYNIIIKGLAADRKADRALAVLSAMAQRRVQANTTTFNTCIDTAIRCGRFHDAWRLHDAMKAQGLKPDRHTCSNVAKLLQSRAAHSGIEGIIDFLGDVRQECSLESYRSLMATAFMASVRVFGPEKDIAKRLYKMMRAEGMTFAAFDLRAFGKLIGVAHENADNASEDVGATERLLAVLDNHILATEG